MPRSTQARVCSVSSTSSAARRRRRGLASLAAPAAVLATGAMAALVALGTAPRAAWADTTGNTGGMFFAPGVFFEVGLPGISLDTNGGEVVSTSLTSPTWGVIANEYIAAVVGFNATYSVKIGDTTYTHNVPGMISFGNTVPSIRYSPNLNYTGGGSLLTATDDGQPLNGNNYHDLQLEAGLVPGGGGVWPLASYWRGTTEEAFDYPSYVRAIVDTTQTDIVGAANVVEPPGFHFDRGIDELRSIYFVSGSTTSGTGGSGRAASASSVKPTGRQTTGGGSSPGGVNIEQDISLLRDTARVVWTIYNNDTVSHTVRLRWTTHVRGGTETSSGANSNSNLPYPHKGFFYSDPTTGVSLLSRLYPDQGAIPNQVTIYGKRYQPEESVDPPFAGRFIFGRDSTDPNDAFVPTTPQRVYIADSAELAPDRGGYDPYTNPDYTDSAFTFGVAVAAYYGPYTLGPGGSQQIVAYYGSGRSTEIADQSTQNTGLSTVLATEAPESLQYNAAAGPGLSSLPSDATFDTIVQSFLQPSSFQIFGDLYNLTVGEPTLGVTVPNVSMSLTLPTGLELASGETLQKAPIAGNPSSVAGTVRPDTDAIAKWQVVANGKAYGPLTYSLNATASGPISFNRTLTRVINVPAVPVLTVRKDRFQALGFPFQFDASLTNGGDPTTIINGSQFSQGTDSNVIFHQWVPDLNAGPPYFGYYRPMSSVTPGQGFYFKSQGSNPENTRTIVLYGATPVANTSSPDPFLNSSSSPGNAIFIALKQGWNLIATPFVYPVPLGSLQVAINQTQLNAVSLLSAINSGLVSPGIYAFDTETQQNDLIALLDTPVNPYQAIWVWANQDAYLVFNSPTAQGSAVVPVNNGTLPVSRSASKKPVGAIASGRAFPAHPSIGNWKLRLIASRGDLVDGTALFGVASNGTDAAGRSVVNLPKPPAMSFGHFLYTGLIANGNDSSGVAGVTSSTSSAAAPSSSYYAQVLRSASSGVKTWDFDVLADTDGPVSLAWPNLATLPKRLDLKLVNAATGQVTSLRSASSVTVNVRGGVPTRFRLVAQTQASRPLTFTNVAVVSNGGGPAGRNVAGAGGEYNISFGLSRDATVTARVSTIGGKVLQTFASGRAATAGQNRIVWDGRSAQGASVPTGAYKVELTARADDGSIKKVTVPVFVTR